MALIQFEAFSDALGKAFSAQIALPETNRGPFPVLWRGGQRQRLVPQHRH